MSNRHVDILRSVRLKFEPTGEIGACMKPEDRDKSLAFFDDVIAGIERGADPLAALVGPGVKLAPEFLDKPEPEQEDLPW